MEGSKGEEGERMIVAGYSLTFEILLRSILNRDVVNNKNPVLTREAMPICLGFCFLSCTFSIPNSMYIYYVIDCSYRIFVYALYHCAFLFL